MRFDLSGAFRPCHLHSPLSACCRCVADDFTNGFYSIALFGPPIGAHLARSDPGVVGARRGSVVRPWLAVCFWPGCLWAFGRELLAHLAAIRAESALGACAAADCGLLYGGDHRLGAELLAWARRPLEKPCL